MWVELLHSQWAQCASSLVPLQVFATSVLYFLPHGMSTESINYLGFHFSEAQKDAPLNWTPPQVQPATMRSQHTVWVCLCTLPAGSSGTAPHSPQDVVIRTFLQWEPSIYELWSASVPSQIKELTHCPSQVITFQTRHHFQFTSSPIAYLQGKAAEQVSHTCNFNVPGLCKKFVVTSNFNNKILLSLQMKIINSTG